MHRESLLSVETEAVELRYIERLSLSGDDNHPLCEVRASEDISEDCCRAALTLFLIESCDNLEPLARRAIEHISSWDKHAIAMASLPHGTKECPVQQASNLVAQLHERGALRIALVLVDGGSTSSDCAWRGTSAFYGIVGVVSVTTLGVGVGEVDCQELPSVPTLHVLPPGVAAPVAWRCEATEIGASQAEDGHHRFVRRPPSTLTATMELLAPGAELWELDSS